MAIKFLSTVQVDTDVLYVDSSNNKVGIGTTTPSSNLEIVGNSGTVLDVQGSQGQLFSVTDNLTGSIFAVSDISGVPIFDVNSSGLSTFDGLVSGITPVAAANFVTKAYVDGSGGGTGPFLPLAGGTMTGVAGVVFPDAFKLNLGTGSDLQISHDGFDSYINNINSSLNIRNSQNDGDIYFQSDNGSGGIATYFYLDGSLTNGTTTLGATRFPDNSKIFMGTGGDLVFNHDGTNSFIDNITGDFTIENAGDDLILKAADDFLVQVQGTDIAIQAIGDGKVGLRYNNVEKFQTTSTGVTVTGNVLASGYLAGQSSQYNPTGGGTTLATLTNNSASRTNLVISNQTNNAAASAALVLATYGHDYFIKGSSSLGGSQLTLGFNTSNFLTLTSSAATFTGNADLAGRLKVGNYWNDSTLSLNSIYVQNSTDGFAFGVGTGISTWFSYSNTAGVNRMIDIDNDGTYIKLRTGNVDRVTVTASGATFAGDITTPSGIITSLGGDNMTIASTAANHGGLSFGTNVIYPSTSTATNDNVFDLGGTAERFKNLYLGGSLYGNYATGTISTNVLAFTQGNAINNTTIATTAYVNNKIALIPAGLRFEGTWDASTGSAPSASPANGQFWIVSVAGSTSLSGITDWKVGDWAIYVVAGAGTDGWQKVDNSSVLDGSGTGNQSAKWAGSGTSNTLTNGSIEDEGTILNAIRINSTTTTTKNYIGMGMDSTNNQRLSLAEADGNGSHIRMVNSRSGGGYFVVGVGDTNSSSNIVPPGGMFFYNGATRMVINSSGNVGIGTTSPTSKLQLKGDGTYIEVRAGDNSQAVQLGTDSSGDGLLQLYSDAGIVKIKLYGEAASPSYINAGNLGIGTTTPNYKLTVSGGINAGGVVTYSKVAGGLDTTGYAVAGLGTVFNGASAGFTFTAYGGTGQYQKVVYSCFGSGTNWVVDKVIDEGTNVFDIVASAASAATIVFTFKTRSGSQGYSPRVVIEATGHSIISTYA